MSSAEGPVYANQPLSRSECLGLLGQASVGRVGLSVDALPAVLPVRYALVEGEVVFRLQIGSKFESAAVESVVAFEADHFDATTGSGWSVLLRGIAHALDQHREIHRDARHGLGRWSAGADRLVRVSPSMISGRRVRPLEP